MYGVGPWKYNKLWKGKRAAPRWFSSSHRAIPNLTAKYDVKCSEDRRRGNFKQTEWPVREFNWHVSVRRYARWLWCAVSRAWPASLARRQLLSTAACLDNNLIFFAPPQIKKLYYICLNAFNHSNTYKTTVFNHYFVGFPTMDATAVHTSNLSNNCAGQTC